MNTGDRKSGRRGRKRENDRQKGRGRWREEDRQNERVGEIRCVCVTIIALKLHVIIILFNRLTNMNLISTENKGPTLYLLSV